MKYEIEDRARHFVVRNILDLEGRMTDYEHAISQGAVPIRDLTKEHQVEMCTLHSILSGIATGANVPVFEDGEDEPKFMAHPELEQNQELIDAWSDCNEMLDESFIEKNDEWYLYVIGG